MFAEFFDLGDRAQIVGCTRMQAAGAGIVLDMNAATEEQPPRPGVLEQVLGRVEAEAVSRAPLLRL